MCAFLFLMFVRMRGPGKRLTETDTSGMSKAEKEEYIIELAAAVRESDLFRIKTAVAEKGRKMLERFIEERVPPEVKERLNRAKMEMIRSELEELLELCDKEGYYIKVLSLLSLIGTA